MGNMNSVKVKIKEVKENPLNPRTIKDHKFKQLVKSIKDFPEMIEYRPIIVDENMVILGGNMRYKAMLSAGLKEVYIEQYIHLNEEEKKEFIIKDNANYGQWDWDILANKYDEKVLEEYGLNVWVPSLDIETEDNVFATMLEGDEDNDSDEHGFTDDTSEKEKKKVIQIEFEPEDYPVAHELLSFCKNNKIEIESLFINTLKLVL
jgi:hypothetical protein